MNTNKSILKVFPYLQAQANDTDNKQIASQLDGSKATDLYYCWASHTLPDVDNLKKNLTDLKTTRCAC